MLAREPLEDDDSLYKYDDFGFIGFDLWQVLRIANKYQGRAWLEITSQIFSSFKAFFGRQAMQVVYIHIYS